MSRIIEICGAPGSGKTTTYNSLTAKWRKEYNWAPTVYPLFKPDHTSLKKFLSTFSALIKKRKNFSLLDEAGERFVAQYPDYMDQFWSSCFFQPEPGYKGVDLRFRNVNVYWSTLRKIQYLRELPSQKIHIACEGLIQRIGNGWYKRQNLDEEKEEAKSLIKLMPLPEAVVYLEVDVQNNVKRIQTRKKMLPAHKNLTEEELKNLTANNQERWHFICSLLQEMHVPVLRLDSGCDVQENAKKIMDFAEQLFRKSAAEKKMSGNLVKPIITSGS